MMIEKMYQGNNRQSSLFDWWNGNMNLRPNAWLSKILKMEDSQEPLMS